MTDIWDDPPDIDAAPDWDPTPPPADPVLPPEPAWNPPPHDDDETAFWRDQRTDTPPDTDPDTAPYAEWLAAQRRSAFTVACPVCKVVAGQPCVRVFGNPPQPVQPPEPIRRYPAHEPRLRAARQRTSA